MKGFKRFLTMLVLVSSMLPGGIGIASAKEYVSISGIREEVRDGWHETYEFNGRTITVAIDITGGQTLSIDAQTGEVVVSTLHDYITWTKVK